jgi:outer membrane protein OmpA-like peptidoglycan-associated protein
MPFCKQQCHRQAWLGWGVFALASLSACATDKPPGTPANELAPSAASEPAASQQVGDGGTAIHLSPEIMADCRFPASPGELPLFDADQASLRPRGRDILADVANCMKDGPLQNRTITIIGRADARGSDAHNHELGANRAEATRNYLLQKGVPEQKLLVTSRGEEGATGDDAASMAIDRRVDLVLGDATTRTNISQNPPANAQKPTDASKGAAYSDQAEGGTVTGSSGPGTASK